MAGEGTAEGGGISSDPLGGGRVTRVGDGVSGEWGVVRRVEATPEKDTVLRLRDASPRAGEETPPASEETPNVSSPSPPEGMPPPVLMAEGGCGAAAFCSLSSAAAFCSLTSHLRSYALPSST